ncbi:MAG: VOC family protein [Gammaproteobacteria bacterium]|nr:VOC family protein [Gammaproteobacteria bacterium]
MTLKVGYLGFEVSDLAAWERLGGLLGLGVAQHDGISCLLVDDYARRVQLLEGPGDDLVYMGWEAADLAEFDAVRARLDAAGVPWTEGDAAGARQRGVQRYLAFRDPDGLPLEVALDLERLATPPVSELVPGGFVTGDAGLGHIAAPSSDYRASSDFLRAVLDARVSDYIFHPLAPNLTADCVFLHTGPRHHSIAYAQMPGPAPKRLHHFMLEAASIVDVGRAYDRLRAAGEELTMQLGQHPNDRMVSFYVRTPSGFSLELGWGGVRVDDDATWQIAEYHNFSLWGHQPAAA